MKMSDLPKFEPLPNVGNVVSNRVTSFNQGYNLYQCINYLQGYVSIVYDNMDALLDDWNNFQEFLNEKIANIATEETQKILNQWMEDGTLNDLIAQNPLWNQKLDKTGGTMTGNIKFSENTKIVGTTPGGNDIDLIHNTNDGASGNYVKFGDPDAKSVINSNQQPVWHNGDDDYLLLTQKQMDDALAGKVSKSGDTMTGNLEIETITRNQNSVITGSVGYTSFGSIRVHTRITSVHKPTFYYDNSDKTPLVEDDIVNNLTSSSTTKPLSAAQGKVLNDKIAFKYKQTVTVRGATFKYFTFNNLVLCRVMNIGAYPSGSNNTFENAVPSELRPKENFYLSYTAITGTQTGGVGRYSFGNSGDVTLITEQGVTLEHSGQIIYSLEEVTE